MGKTVKVTMREKTPLELMREAEYDEKLKSCVLLKTPHVQSPLREGWLANGQLPSTRLYTVTTIAQSDRYGGTRTPVICDSFDIAKKIVEENQGDIWEYSYMLAVIEAIVPNFLYGGGLMEQYWYKWMASEDPEVPEARRMDHGSYRPIEIPEAERNIFGYGIG